MLSKKYYKAIAESIKSSTESVENKQTVVKMLNGIFLKDNSRFRADFFEKMALGVVLTPQTESKQVITPASSSSSLNRLEHDGIKPKRRFNRWKPFKIQSVDFLNNGETSILEDKDFKKM